MACSVAVGSPAPFSPKLLIPTAAAAAREASTATAAFQLSSPSSSSSSANPFRPPRLQRRPSGLRASYSIITPTASNSSSSSSSSSSSPATRGADDTPCCSTAVRSAAARDQPSPLKRKRPARLDMSAVDPALDAAGWAAAAADTGRVSEVKADGASFSVYSKRGRARARLEDRYLAADHEEAAAAQETAGGRKPSLFGVFDGHGGPAAAEYISTKIKNHLFSQLPTTTTATTAEIAEAVKAGYLTTDTDLLGSVPTGGACAVTALITRDNRLVVSHAGDCRAVLCRGGAAEALTTDHRPGRPDEKDRIEALGGYVDSRHGVWRVQGSLAVSRAFGDQHLKEWVSAEPDTRVLPIDPDCQFLIMASDGLWDKVSDQEAVALAVDGGMASAADTCRVLADLAVSRGSMDDVTVMLVKLAGYAARC